MSFDHFDLVESVQVSVHCQYQLLQFQSPFLSVFLVTTGQFKILDHVGVLQLPSVVLECVVFQYQLYSLNSANAKSQ